MSIQEQIKRGGKGKGSNPLAGVLGASVEQVDSREAKEGLTDINAALAAAQGAMSSLKKESAKERKDRGRYEKLLKITPVIAKVNPCPRCLGTGKVCRPPNGMYRGREFNIKTHIGKCFGGGSSEGWPHCGKTKDCPSCGGSGEKKAGGKE